jgi:RHS repeat-associated protein
MITDYKWVRHIVPPTSYLSGISTGVANNFATYMSDFLFGTRVRWQVESTDSAGTYYWRFRTVTAYAKIYDIEVEYTFTRSGGGAINSETLRGRSWNSAGTAPETSFAAIPITGSGPGDITFDALFPPGSTSGVDAETAETIFPGTTYAQYEHRNGSYALVAGGIGSSAGDLGVAGFDIRMLAIKNLRAEKVVTNLSSDENTVNFKMDIYALPGTTSLFSAWQPASVIDFVVQVGDLSATDLYYELLGGVTASTPTSAGLVASVSIPTADRWPGTDLSGNIIEGLSLVLAQALADNPDGIPTTSLTRLKATNALTYQCCSCSNGCMTQGVSLESTSGGPYGAGLEPVLSYTSFDYGQAPASMGYGWSSEASSRIIDSGTELVFRSGGGGYLRWIEDSGSYVPFSPGNYTEAVVDTGSTTARYKLTFKDQRVFEFDSTGKLRKKIDRNGNTLTYSYNGTTGYLETISDGNGRSHHYTNRSDGQPLTLRVNNATTGRLTQFAYYSSSDPDSPDRLWKIIDPELNETEFVYYPDGPLQAIIDPQGNIASIYEYDVFGRLYREELYEEVLRTHFYGTSGNSHEILEEDLVGSEPDRSRYTELDGLGRVVRVLELVSATGPVVNETLMEYNDPSVSPFNPNPYLLKRQTDPNLTYVEMTYTDNGNLKTFQDKEQKVTTYTYAEEIDSPLNPKHRNLVREIQRPEVTIGVPAPVTYDPTVFEYDPNGNLERVIDASGEETEMTYDTDGLVLTIKNRLGHITELEYEGNPFNNESRNLIEVRVPKGTSSLDGFRVTELEYDYYDNVTVVRDALGNETVMSYDDLDRVEDSKVRDPLGAVVGGTTYFEYPNMLLEEVTLPPNNGSGSNSRKVSMVYDSSNRLEEVLRDIGVSTQELRVGYGYTAFSQLARLTRTKNGNLRSFTHSFDRLGRTATSSDSLPSPNTGVSSMAYAPYCSEKASTSARGIRRRLVFDDRCLPLSLSAGDPDSGDPLDVLNVRELREWQHDELGRMVKSLQTRPARYGQPLSAVMGLDVYGGQAEQRLYLFDELDRLRKMTFEDGSEMLWDYDLEGNLTKMTDPQGKVTRLAYYRDNLLKEVRVERPSQPDRVFGYSYDAAGRLLAITYPTSPEVVAKFDDGTSTPGSGWDARGRLRHLRYERDGDLIRRFELDYDASDNRSMILDVTDGSVLTAKAIKWEFLYDWLDRLVTVNRSEAVSVGSLPSTLAPFSSYSYDESDNRVTYRDEVADRTYRYVVDDADNLIEVYVTEGSDPEVLVEEIGKDADGNMTTRTNADTGEVITYEWSDFDRLLRVSSAIGGTPTATVKESNRYDVNGIRKRKMDRNGNGSKEFTAGISTASSKAASSGSSAPTISYIMGAGQILGAEVNGNFQFFLTDALGTVRDVVDDTGAVIRSQEYDEHGNLISSSGTGTFAPKTYQGALSVNDDTADSGLWLMGHRHYDSRVGRFISRDPIGFRGSLNLFASHSVNPIRFVDPSGLNPVVIWVLVGATGIAANELLAAKEYAQAQAKDLVSRNLNEHIEAQPPDPKNPKFPRDGSYKCQVLNDKYKHCVVSCKVARQFGASVAWAIGYGHELQGFPMKPDARYDMIANQTGIDIGASSDADCEAACESKYQKSYLWQGTKTVLPPNLPQGYSPSSSFPHAQQPPATRSPSSCRREEL